MLWIFRRSGRVHASSKLPAIRSNRRILYRAGTRSARMRSVRVETVPRRQRYRVVHRLAWRSARLLLGPRVLRADLAQLQLAVERRGVLVHRLSRLSNRSY